jgi:hypothetical protein
MRRKLMLVGIAKLKILLIPFFLIVVMFAGFLLLVMSLGEGETGVKDNGIGIFPIDGRGGKANVPEAVRRWEPLVKKHAEANGIGDYVEFILALIMAESGGMKADVMQASESKCGSIGCITTPEESIEWGVTRFAQLIGTGGQFYVSVQAYNMGNGFINHALGLGATSADLFSIEEAAKAYATKYAYGDSCGWRSPYCYGNYKYVPHILRHFESAVIDVTGGGIANQMFPQIIAMASKYEGQPYVFGGRKPPHFDCSGLIEYVYGQHGISISGTAQDQYDKTVPVTDPLPGDLVFFTGTYNAGRYITHVGIYIGNNRMFNAGGTHLHYADLNSPFWKKAFVGIRRVVK